MLRVRGTVRRGRLVVDDPTELPEGSEVILVTAEDDEWTPELSTELLRRYEDVSRGGSISGDELISKLRAR
jgi:hypothetical protein